MHKIARKMGTMGLSTALSIATLPGCTQQRMRDDKPGLPTPDLTLAELTKLKDIEETIALYRSHGYYPENPADYAKALFSDWVRLGLAEANRLHDDLSFQFSKPLSVTVNNQTYVIHGVVHDENLVFDYRWYFFTELKNKSVLCEEKLSPWVGSNAIELADHTLIHEKLNGQPFAQFMFGMFGISPSSMANPDYPPDFKLDKATLISAIEQHSQGELDFHKTLAEMPLETLSTSLMPAAVTLELKTYTKRPLNVNEGRSAYMAEVLRRWNIPGEKHIITGGSHAAEIAWFLEHPVKDRRILLLAEKHAEIINGSDSAKPLLKAQEIGPWYRAGCGSYPLVLMLPDPLRAGATFVARSTPYWQKYEASHTNTP